VTELGEGILQKLVAAGITTVESLADMTPEQLEEIPGIGEKTLERISVAVRHYFGHFEEGDAGQAAEGASEVETAPAAAASAEAEAENSAEVLEEAESMTGDEPAVEKVSAAGREEAAEPDGEEAGEKDEAAKEDGV